MVNRVAKLGLFGSDAEIKEYVFSCLAGTSSSKVVFLCRETGGCTFSYFQLKEIVADVKSGYYLQLNSASQRDHCCIIISCFVKSYFLYSNVHDCAIF